jgi:hypothetical protein
MNVLIVVDVQKEFQKFIQFDLVYEISKYAESFDKVYQIYDTHKTNKPSYKFPKEIDAIPKLFGKNHFNDKVKEFTEEIKNITDEGTTYKLSDGGYVVRVDNNHDWFYVNPEITDLINSIKTDNVILAGGASQECIFDVYVAFKAFGVNVEINEKYTYSAKTSNKNSVKDNIKEAYIPIVEKEICIRLESNDEYFNFKNKYEDIFGIKFNILNTNQLNKFPIFFLYNYQLEHFSILISDITTWCKTQNINTLDDLYNRYIYHDNNIFKPIFLYNNMNEFFYAMENKSYEKKPTYNPRKLIKEAKFYTNDEIKNNQHIKKYPKYYIGDEIQLKYNVNDFLNKEFGELLNYEEEFIKNNKYNKLKIISKDFFNDQWFSIVKDENGEEMFFPDIAFVGNVNNILYKKELVYESNIDYEYLVIMINNRNEYLTLKEAFQKNKIPKELDFFNYILDDEYPVYLIYSFYFKTFSYLFEREYKVIDALINDKKLYYQIFNINSINTAINYINNNGIIIPTYNSKKLVYEKNNYEYTNNIKLLNDVENGDFIKPKFMIDDIVKINKNYEDIYFNNDIALYSETNDFLIKNINNKLKIISKFYHFNNYTLKGRWYSGFYNNDSIIWIIDDVLLDIKPTYNPKELIYEKYIYSNEELDKLKINTNIKIGDSVVIKKDYEKYINEYYLDYFEKSFIERNLNNTLKIIGFYYNNDEKILWGEVNDNKYNVYLLIDIFEKLKPSYKSKILINENLDILNESVQSANFYTNEDIEKSNIIKPRFKIGEYVKIKPNYEYYYKKIVGYVPKGYEYFIKRNFNKEILIENKNFFYEYKNEKGEKFNNFWGSKVKDSTGDIIFLIDDVLIYHFPQYKKELIYEKNDLITFNFNSDIINNFSDDEKPKFYIGDSILLENNSYFIINKLYDENSYEWYSEIEKENEIIIIKDNLI